MATNIERLYEEYKNAIGISTDTRKINTGDLFFALKGENFDANEFTSAAIEKGASCVIIDNPKYEVTGKTLLVNDVLSALQDLARHHRKMLKIPVIGLTGSNGKTTTKELIKVVLQKKYQTFATFGNLNNHIGVPVSLLSVGNDTEVAVIEMGANHVGEIAFLCEIAMPTHGLITNIGKAHIGEFGGFENIIRAKSELYHYLIKSGGKIFVNSRQEILKNMSKRMTAPIFYPEKGDYYHCHLQEASPWVVLQTEDEEVVKTQIPGQYNFDNIASALCIGKFFGVPAGNANQAVAEYLPSNNRSQIVNRNNSVLILDAYNANPSSMEAALLNLKDMKSRKKAVILGDMMELGEDTEKEHRNIGGLLNKMGFDEVFLCGKYMRFAAEECSGSKYAVDREALVKVLQSMKFDDHTILIKGSRSMALEKVVEHIN